MDLILNCVRQNARKLIEALSAKRQFRNLQYLCSFTHHAKEIEGGIKIH